MEKSPCLYARDEARPLLNTLSAIKWSQSETARQSKTSSATVSRLLGLVGARVSPDAAERIATALGSSVDELFTADPPPEKRVGQRWRPARPPQDRYDGAAAKADAERWRQYLDEIRAEAERLGCDLADVQRFDWPSKLSLVRASERFDLDPHTLSKAAAAKPRRVRSRRVRRRGLGRYHEGRVFSEREFYEDLQELPSCDYPDCERRALGPSGGCETHGHALAAMGTKRPPEVGRAIAKTKRENPRSRSDAKERADRLHCERRERMDDELALDELSLSGAAESLSITSHAVSELVARGELTPTRYVEHEIGRPAPIFTKTTINARKRKVALAEDLATPSAWGGAVPLDPDRQVELARADGRLQRLTESIGSESKAIRVIREEIHEKRRDYRNHARGRKRESERRARFLLLLEEVIADDRIEVAELSENALLEQIALRAWQTSRHDFPSDWQEAPGDPGSYDRSLRKNAVEHVRRMIGPEVKKVLQIAALKIAS